MNKKKNFSYARYGYLFSVPFVVAFLIFQLYPTLYTAVIGFTDLKGIGKTDWHFLEKPFANFVTILTSPTFQTAFKNTIKLWVCNFIPQLALALLLAAWFTDRRFKIPGEGIFKVLFYMPNIITAATVAILFNEILGEKKKKFYMTVILLPYLMSMVIIAYLVYAYLSPSAGLFTKAIERITGTAPAFYQETKWWPFILTFVNQWRGIGFGMIMYLSSILGIDPSLYEAAKLDGATRWQQHIKVTIPLMKPRAVPRHPNDRHLCVPRTA